VQEKQAKNRLADKSVANLAAVFAAIRLCHFGDEHSVVLRVIACPSQDTGILERINSLGFGHRFDPRECTRKCIIWHRNGT